MRSSFDGALENPPVLEFARNVIVERIVERLEGEEVALRASLIASQLIGLAIGRYMAMARLEPVASSTVDEVVALYAPAMQRLITPGH